MKHRLGNSPMCYSCHFFREREGDLTPDRCLNPRAQCCNGKVNPHPRPYMSVQQNRYACPEYIECETGFTRFEINTGKHEDDLSPIDFENEVCLWRLMK